MTNGQGIPYVEYMGDLIAGGSVMARIELLTGEDARIPYMGKLSGAGCMQEGMSMHDLVRIVESNPRAYSVVRTRLDDGLTGARTLIFRTDDGPLLYCTSVSGLGIHRNAVLHWCAEHTAGSAGNTTLHPDATITVLLPEKKKVNGYFGPYDNGFTGYVNTERMNDLGWVTMCRTKKPVYKGPTE